MINFIKNKLKKLRVNFNEIFYSFKGFLLTIIMLFISVNILDYKDSTFTFNLSNLKYLYLNPFSFSADKSGIFFSLVTILGLWFAFKQLLISNEQSKSGNLQLEIYNKQLVELSAATKLNINQLNELIEQTKTSKEHFLLVSQKQEEIELTTHHSIINGLIDELKHNINLSNHWVWYEDNIFYEQIVSKLNSYNEFIYPEIYFPDEFSINGIKLVKNEPLNIDRMVNLMKMRNDFLLQILSDRSIISVLKSRIFLNLRHFNYSIVKYNECVDNFNKTIDLVKRLKLSNTYFIPDHLNNQINNDYLIVRDIFIHTVALRMNYMLIDLVLSMEENNFIDKEFLNELLQKIQKSKLKIYDKY